MASAARGPLLARATAARRPLCTPSAAAETVSMTFIDEDGEEVEVQAEVGKSLLEVAHANEIDLEGADRHTRPVSFISNRGTCKKTRATSCVC